MFTEPMEHVGGRIPRQWLDQIKDIAAATGRKPSDLFREAIASYLGKTDPTAIKAKLLDHDERLSRLEAKLAGLSKLGL